ncbi:8-amino-7-oxononanoate synthase [Pyronema domesticum]|uniref:Similar to 8-amino-7-oxononanoate synthase acc. no. Q1DCV8 n=1 Tax=Pyronema omphalodes (strain CBS 100304) TaxID=1076935 RepID=U4L2P7_PYROM|nr:8-amino-7-oxononanoate synthase [Pyronema domesticum]CCX04345.1 Similar to 8-amino-7-oxononanoate synthase; acc. no. Q1DCV8 [Pyronema omphalodes CBS 100304]
MPLSDQLQTALTRRRQLSFFRTLTLPRPNTADFSSNDFLSLSTNAELRTEFLSELQFAGDFPLGSGGSRLLDGNTPYTESLESRIATFLGAPCGLLFNSGFDANSGFFSCIPQPGDAVVYDELIHASVHEGMRLSRAAEKVKFLHNDVEDLCRVLQRVKQPGRNIFVAVEGLYSMDGDTAPLRKIVEAVENICQGTGHVVVDEAHSTGCFGPNGRGLTVSLGLEKRVFARLHTFGKSLASNGAIILCDPLVREYLINYARTLIFTTALGFPALASVKAAFAMLERGDTVPLQEKLHDNITCLHDGLKSLPSSGRLSILNPKQRDTPIVALLTDKPRDLAKWLQDGGYMVRPIVHPTVPKGKERVRVCLHSGNTISEIRGLVSRILTWVDVELRTEQVSEQSIFKSKL